MNNETTKLESAFKLADELRARIIQQRDEAYTEALKSQAGYKFEMYGYWASAWVKFNSLLSKEDQAENPFYPFVNMARELSETKKVRTVRIYYQFSTEVDEGIFIAEPTKAKFNELSKAAEADSNGGLTFPDIMEYHLTPDGIAKAFRDGAWLAPK